ncbi:MAG: KpsF/GutQ family sugar-phosphate isomerase [Planctomycetes bacterium]|nr:KpsF/GutQ family sugar-phosphate isomerase [Planctomycetota bacterium]
MSGAATKTARKPTIEDGRQATLATGLAILRKEAQAIQDAADRLGGAFVEAVDLLMKCPGRVAVTGMGKAGLIGSKIQATFSSTATPAYFLHPVEALHGDLGMVHADDVVLALSRSGETQELIQLLPLLKRIGCHIILMTSKPNSHCGQLSDAVLDIGDAPEACPLGLAPSSSTAAMLAVGDALALTVMELKGVRPDQYAAFHPGGALGRSLMKVQELMRTGPDCPRIPLSGSLLDFYTALDVAPRRAGAAAIVDNAGKLCGIFTQGDLTRLRPDSAEPDRVPIADCMTAPCKSTKADDRVADALLVMRRYGIDELPVVDADGGLVGMLDIQDLLACGFSAFDAQ